MIFIVVDCPTRAPMIATNSPRESSARCHAGRERHHHRVGLMNVIQLDDRRRSGCGLKIGTCGASGCLIPKLIESSFLVTSPTVFETRNLKLETRNLLLVSATRHACPRQAGAVVDSLPELLLIV